MNAKKIMADGRLDDIAFPRLDDAQLDAFEHCSGAHLRHFNEGQRLTNAGDHGFKFFVVKQGAVAIVDESGDEPNEIAVLGRGEFTGEVSHLTGGPSLVTVVARTETDAYEVSSDGVRHIINRSPSLGDRILQAFIARRQRLSHMPSFGGLRVIGSRYSKHAFRIRDFLSRNRIPFTWLDVEEHPEVDALLREFEVPPQDTPVVAFGHRLLLRKPSNVELAEALGIRHPLDNKLYDLVIVGAGPAGLAAAVYAASEGLQTIVLDRSGPGGQAGSSMRIENYLGFPTGITGAELAERATVQMGKFGAGLAVPSTVNALGFDDRYPLLHIQEGETVAARCVLIATGAEYRRLVAEGCEAFEGSGVYYAATPNEAPMCRGTEVAVIGAGNSAGQAAVYLSEMATRVYLLIRGDDLNKSMSAYLVERIKETPQIEVLENTEVAKFHGEDHLHAIEIRNNKTGKRKKLHIANVFCFIGATPHTGWLPSQIERDNKGFVMTGGEVATSPHWTARRPPLLLETSQPGVFAAGDVRCGSVKRVASAVGEGAMAVMFVHQALKEL